VLDVAHIQTAVVATEDQLLTCCHQKSESNTVKPVFVRRPNWGNLTHNHCLWLMADLRLRISYRVLEVPMCFSLKLLLFF